MNGRAAFFILVLLFPGWAWGQTGAPPLLQPHVAANRGYALHKPAAWQVRDEGGAMSLRIQVNSPDQSRTVDFFLARPPQGRPQALGVLAAWHQTLGRTLTGLTWSEVFASPDGARAAATLHAQGPTGPLLGRYYFEATAQGLLAQGYRAPAPRLAQERPLLFNIMASLALAKGTADGAGAAWEPQYFNRPLTARRAADGSLSISLPADWEMAAAGGKVVAAGPQGGMGFIFTSLSGNPILRGASVLQGIIAQPYLAPPQALQAVLAGFGHRDIRILSAQPDPAARQEFARQVGRDCDAQDIQAAWTSARGAPCRGFIKVISAAPSPTGLWFCLLAGVWGPGRDFYRLYPLLEQVASSFAINDQYARRYIADGLKRARELHDKTLAAMRENSRARERQQSDWEARQARKDMMESRWDDYRRGKSYWVSDLEGGKVYQTDRWGTQDSASKDYYEGRGYNYTNFQGTNPRHPSETMREVSSHEVQQLLGRGR